MKFTKIRTERSKNVISGMALYFNSILNKALKKIESEK